MALRSLKGRHKIARIGEGVLFASLLLSILLLLVLAIGLVLDGKDQLGWSFLTNFPSSRPASAGIWPAMVGSFYLMLVTIAFSLPIGVAAAVYLTEFAFHSRFSQFTRYLMHNLAGVPSIVYGLVGFSLFVRVFDFGTSLLSGGLTLGLMTLPVIIITAEQALLGVPKGFRDAALALGATRRQAVWHHVLPNATAGIATGCVLALSRAIGETAPILFMGALFAKSPPSNLLDSFLALPLTIFYWLRHPKEEFHQLGAAAIVVLLVLLLMMNTLAIVYRYRAQARKEW